MATLVKCTKLFNTSVGALEYRLLHNIDEHITRIPMTSNVPVTHEAEKRAKPLR